MWLIQLQYADEGGENQGGLYLNVDAIAAVRNENGGPHRAAWCKILMVDGTEHRVFQSTFEVTEEINRILIQKNKNSN